MIKTDKSALICDLAETYHIYDYRSLPLSTVAAFSVGLRDDSRIKMKLAGVKYSFDTMLLASIVDNLNLRTWSMSEDGRNGVNKPASIVNKLLGREEANSSDAMVFDSGKAFEEMRKKIIEGGGK